MTQIGEGPSLETDADISSPRRETVGVTFVFPVFGSLSCLLHVSKTPPVYYRKQMGKGRIGDRPLPVKVKKLGLQPSPSNYNPV